MPYKNKAEQRAAQHRWYKEHKKITQKRSNNWKKKNPEKVKAGDRKYRKENREKIRERQNKWERENTAALTDYYLIKELGKNGIPPELVRKYPDMIEAMREYYLTVRLIVKMNKDAKKKEGRI